MKKIKVNKFVVLKQNKLKTTNFPKILGVIYKLRGELGEPLLVAYDKHFDCLRYIGSELQEKLDTVNTKKDLLREIEDYRSLHDNDYRKNMKPKYITDDFTEKDKMVLSEYGFQIVID